MSKLGVLKKVDLRAVWEHEALDFTKWLSKEHNLNILSDEIGIGIQLRQTEARVGKFNVDILAEEENSGRKIVIENQLEMTDHTHLGQIITYAAGFDAEIVIWIVKDVREEHKQAIDWLNENSNEKVNFFIVRMELWQINDSEYAPKFNIISEPNDWAKAIKISGGMNQLSSTKLMQFEFWNGFKDFVKKNRSMVNLRKAYPQHWMDVSFGTSQAHISLTVNTQNKLISCGVWIPDSKDLFEALYEKKENIENEIGTSLVWHSPENKKSCGIWLRRTGDISELEKWEEYFEWLETTTTKFQEVFSKYINEIKQAKG